jgi:hypothetical protein
MDGSVQTAPGLSNSSNRPGGPVTGLVVRQAGYWSGSLPPGRKTDRQAEKTDRHAEK